jgi:hypothetical protein
MKDLLIIKGQVVWSRLQASGVVETGVEFLELTPELQFQLDNVIQFLRTAVPPPSP